VEFVVRQWLLWVRTISTDPVVFAQHLEQAKDFMTHKGWTLMTAHLRAQQDRLNKGETVQITFGTMLPVAGHARSFEVEWHEVAYNNAGYAIANTQWKAILKIAVYPQHDLTSLKEMRNPLGVFIEEVHWGERVRERRDT
jgi:type IV secretory pathway TrbF-like protein